MREVEGGGTIADIAHSLGLSQGTVRNHVSSAMLKMNARTRAEAASLARAAGWPVGGPPPQGWYQSDTITAWL